MENLHSDYFNCKRGLRQGDPLSPFLFDLVTDALCQIIKIGVQAGYIEGLGPSLQDGYKITHCLYADDTLFFLKADVKVVEAVKWAMVAFEGLTGIRINLNKTELVPRSGRSL